MNPKTWLMCTICGYGRRNYQSNPETGIRSKYLCPVDNTHGHMNIQQDLPAMLGVAWKLGQSSYLFQIIQSWVGFWINEEMRALVPGLPDPTIYRTAKELIPLLRDAVAPLVDTAYDPGKWNWERPFALAQHIRGLGLLLSKECGMQIQFLPGTARKTYRWAMFDEVNPRPAELK